MRWDYVCGISFLSARLAFKGNVCHMCHMVEGCSSDSPWFFGVLYRISHTIMSICACRDFFPFSVLLRSAQTEGGVNNCLVTAVMHMHACAKLLAISRHIFSLRKRQGSSLAKLASGGLSL
jgi:hypothetical protein